MIIFNEHLNTVLSTLQPFTQLVQESFLGEREWRAVSVWRRDRDGLCHYRAYILVEELGKSKLQINV